MGEAAAMKCSFGAMGQDEGASLGAVRVCQHVEIKWVLILGNGAWVCDM